MFGILKSIAAIATVVSVAGCNAIIPVEPPGGDYKKVSELVPLPDFLPGFGTLYVQPATLPVGPFLAYDRTGKLATTIYMIPLDEFEAQADFPHLDVGSNSVKSVDVEFNAGHPGVAEPHYHVVLWHIAPEKAQLE